ncbi:unnamed protein product [Ostreobium quekettii]|uniref:K Homology domain-containing protein n=1 Tax=Ostreobium quekettii TaxID=121088 RepID=A0A8S1IUV4_9CHLO|nr:unnamed protein product [Ostreobium quekettii]
MPDVASLQSTDLDARLDDMLLAARLPSFGDEAALPARIRDHLIRDRSASLDLRAANSFKLASALKGPGPEGPPSPPLAARQLPSGCLGGRSVRDVMAAAAAAAVTYAPGVGGSPSSSASWDSHFNAGRLDGDLHGDGMGWRGADVDYRMRLPSGPRKAGEGVEDVFQHIVAVEKIREGCVLVRTTLLVAGFIIGSSGMSIRGIIQKSGASITSSTVLWPPSNPRGTREFMIVGPSESVAYALDIMYEAVDRYKKLSEGLFAGQHVERCQTIRDVQFFYQPPPRGKVPYAAGIKVRKPSSIANGSSCMLRTRRPEQRFNFAKRH